MWLGDILPFCLRNMWPSTHQIPTHWTSLFGCMLITRPALSVTQISTNSRTLSTGHWDAISEDYIPNGWMTFRGRLEAIIADKISYELF
uniref:Uncharacterized protein n=1 Tax=Lepeophtheirus salmonis TaxID=72036 RepID=A0A0K2T6G3_LEPSM